MLKRVSVLRGNDIISKLYDEHQQFFVENSSVKRITKGEVIVEEGANILFVVFPIDSAVSIQIHPPGDASVEVLPVGRTSIIGGHIAIGARRSRFLAKTIVSGDSVWVPAADFMRLVNDNEHVRDVVLESVRNEFSIIASLKGCSTRNSAAYRIGCWLGILSDLCGRTHLDITQRDIADCFGIRLATASDSCRALKDDGYIDYTRGDIQVNKTVAPRRACACRDFYSLN